MVVPIFAPVSLATSAILAVGLVVVAVIAGTSIDPFDSGAFSIGNFL